MSTSSLLTLTIERDRDDAGVAMIERQRNGRRVGCLATPALLVHRGVQMIASREHASLGDQGLHLARDPRVPGGLRAREQPRERQVATRAAGSPKRPSPSSAVLARTRRARNVRPRVRARSGQHRGREVIALVPAVESRVGAGVRLDVRHDGGTDTDTLGRVGVTLDTVCSLTVMTRSRCL